MDQYRGKMKDLQKNRIHFEPWIEIRPDMAIIETFQDGSQLIRKHGHVVVLEGFLLTSFHLNTNIVADSTVFSFN
jgi:hypothetical protein